MTNMVRKISLTSEISKLSKTNGISKIYTVKAPIIAHLSLLTSVGYNQKETKLKKCTQPNKVIIIYYLHRVQNEKYFTDLKQL